MMTTQSLQSFETLCDMLERNDIDYSRNDDRITVHCTISGKDISVPVAIAVNPYKMLVTLYALMPITVEADKAADMGIAVCLANKALTDGCFVYDIEDGSLYFKMTASCRDGEISEESFEYMLAAAMDMVDEYYPKLNYIAQSTQSFICIDTVQELLC
ncbi:MAG: YbjN domain-containing protein [Acutalibacteraceae bacterium]